MAQAAALFSVMGGVMSAVGAYQQGMAAYHAGNFNAKMAEQNSKMAIAQAAEEERRHRINTRLFMGEMQATLSMAGGGNTSALDLLENSSANAELDALTIRHGGALQAAQFRNEATLHRMGAAGSASAAKMGMASGLLTAAESAASYYPSSGDVKPRYGGTSSSGSSYSSSRGSRNYLTV